MSETSAGLSRLPRVRANLVVALVGAALLIGGAAVLVTRYETGSIATTVMDPVVAAGEVALIDQSATEPRRGDVVMILSDAWPGEPAGLSFPLRIVGEGGDTVVCCDPSGRLQVNGGPLAEDYAYGDTKIYGEFTVRVPPGRLFVLGDARQIARDSRAHLDSLGGTVSTDKVDGRVVAVVWPVWGVLGISETEVFENAGLGTTSWRPAVHLYSLVAVVLGVGLLFGAFRARLRSAGSALRSRLRSIRRAAAGNRS